MRELISPNDAIWLQDSDTNLMVINAVIITDHIDVPTLRKTFQERIFEGPDPARFERLRCRITEQGPISYWEVDQDFSLARHIVPARGKNLKSLADVQAYVGRMANRKLKEDRPRWEIKVSRNALILVPGAEAATSAPAAAAPAPLAPPPPAATAVTQVAGQPAALAQAAANEPNPRPAPALTKVRAAVTHESLLAYYKRCWTDATGLLPAPLTFSAQGDFLQAQAAATATLFIQGVKEGLHVPQANPDDVPF